MKLFVSECDRGFYIKGFPKYFLNRHFKVRVSSDTIFLEETKIENGRKRRHGVFKVCAGSSEHAMRKFRVTEGKSPLEGTYDAISEKNKSDLLEVVMVFKNSTFPFTRRRYYKPTFMQRLIRRIFG